MPMLIGGQWREAISGRTDEIASPYDGSPVGTVPRAGVADAEAAVSAAEAGAVTWRRTPAHERMRVLLCEMQRRSCSSGARFCRSSHCFVRHHNCKIDAIMGEARP